MGKNLILAFVIAILLILSTPVVFGEDSPKEIIVDKDGNGDYNSISSAILKANEGDTIRIYAGTFEENLIIFKSLTIIGNGSSKTFIKGDGFESTIHIGVDNCKIEGLHISNGGIGIDNVGNAGIFIDSNDNKILDCNCSNNRNIGLIINIYREGNIIENCTFVENSKGIMLFECENNQVIKNKCIDNGGSGIELLDSNKNQIQNNICNFNARGIYLRGEQNEVIDNDFRYNDDRDIVNRGDNKLENNQGEVEEDNDPDTPTPDKSMIFPALIIIGLIILVIVIIVIKKAQEKNNYPPSQ